MQHSSPNLRATQISSPALTQDKARAANRLHRTRMQELIAKANQVILEAQLLRREQRLLRYQASVLASQLGQTIVQAHRVESQFNDVKTSLCQMLSEP